MKRTETHIIAIELIKNKIASLKHDQESQFIAGEHDMVNKTQNIINKLTTSLVSLNELSVTHPLRNINKLREKINKRNIKEEGSVSFDTMWHGNQKCAIVPLMIMKHLELEI